MPGAEEENFQQDGVRIVAMMFLSIYQVLNLDKAMQKAAKAGDASA